MEIVQLVRPIFCSRYNASILLENSKVENIVDVGTHDEDGVTGSRRQLLEISEQQQADVSQRIAGLSTTPGGGRPFAHHRQ